MTPRYGSGRDALIAVEEGYNYWSGRLTESSFHLSVAVIAANWACFENAQGIRQNSWAVFSIALVFLSLFISLVGAKRMSEAHFERYIECENDPSRWDAEHTQFSNARHPWPFTVEIELTGWFLRVAKTWLPVASAVALLVAVLSRAPTDAVKPSNYDGVADVQVRSTRSE
ncbi:hypothetical protein [Lysobacter xanthus]